MSYEFLTQLLSNFEIKEGDSFQILFLGPDLIVVDTLEGWNVPGANFPQRVAMRGDIEAFSIADIISMINMNKKTGILSFVFSDATKSLFFLKGEIVYATSSLSQDRLGESLLRAGRITRDQLDDVLGDSEGRGMVGKLLVDRGYLFPKDLYTGVKRQVEEIIYSLFLLRKGTFFFFEGEFPMEGLTKISMSAQNLVMEGIRRVDEWSLFLEKIPAGQLILSKKNKLPEISLTSAEASVLNLVDGKSTVEDVCRRSGFGDFEAYKSLYRLLTAGFVEYSSGEELTSPSA